MKIKGMIRGLVWRETRDKKRIEAKIKNRKNKKNKKNQ
jgi:hypothetical protein